MNRCSSQQHKDRDGPENYFGSADYSLLPPDLTSRYNIKLQIISRTTQATLTTQGTKTAAVNEVSIQINIPPKKLALGEITAKLTAPILPNVDPSNRAVRTGGTADNMQTDSIIM